MLKKIFSYCILPIVIIGLVLLIVRSVLQPVNFNKEKASREQVGVQRLKDIRTLQVAYKTEKGVFTASIDTLKEFYNEGSIKIVMQIGSNDDSLAVDNTQKLKKKYPKVTGEDMNGIMENGDPAAIRKQYPRLTVAEVDKILSGGLVFSIESAIAVKDTLFTTRNNFVVDSLAFIPFSGDSILMDAVVRTVSGVEVPLFEASMPYKSLLRGMNNQLRINLDAERKDTGRYPGLQVGSVTSPNNNAGNWE